MKIFKKFIYIIVIFFFVFFAGGLIITFLYEDEVTDYIIKEINKNLKTEIVVDKVNFSVLKRFPNASLEFKDLVTKSVTDFGDKDFKELNNDTLFTARSLILKFNIIDIFRKNYKIKTIHSKKGMIRILIDKDGKNNYSIWKDYNEENNSNFNINLENIVISNYNCLYINLSAKLSLNTDIKHLRINGDILSKKSDLITTSVLYINELSYNDIKYMDSKALFFHADINKNSEHFILNESRLSVDKMKFNLNGEYSADSNDLALNIQGKNISIPSFLTIFPLKFQNKFNNYTISGTGSFDLSISGNTQIPEKLNFETSFDLVNAELRKNNSNYYLADIYCKGTYSNGGNNNISDSRIELSEYSISYERNTISGNLSMRNFPDPNYTLSAKSHFYIKDLKKLADLKPVDDLDGIIIADLQIEGNIKDLKNISVRNLNISKIKGNMTIQDGSLLFIKNLPDLTGINAWIKLNNTIICDSVYFKTEDNNCFFRGEFQNVINHLSDNKEVIYINGSLFSDYFNADKYFPRDSIADPEEKNAAIFPDNINLNLSFSADRFSYYNFEARQVESRLSYRPKMLVINSFSLSALEGEISGGGAIIQKYNKEFLLKSQSRLSNININHLFYSFNNFGQNYIIYENLKGALSGYLNFSSECNSDLSVKEEKIVAESSFEIYNGELINFEPMKNLSRFIEVSELEHIKFSTLKNEIFIKDKQVIIPQMDINSSAINFSGSGKHNFNSDFNYRTKVLLSEVLSRKAKSAKKENEEFGIIEDDGLGKISLYLTFTGNADDYKISYDNKTVKEVIKNNIAEERNELKTILNEEFGWFQKENKSISDTSFTFEWDEPDIITTNQNKGKTDTNSVNFIIEWDEDKKILPDTIKKKKKRRDK